jgi:hypothetical protein
MLAWSKKRAVPFLVALATFAALAAASPLAAFATNGGPGGP